MFSKLPLSREGFSSCFTKAGSRTYKSETVRDIIMRLANIALLPPDPIIIYFETDMMQPFKPTKSFWRSFLIRPRRRSSISAFVSSTVNGETERAHTHREKERKRFFLFMLQRWIFPCRYQDAIASFDRWYAVEILLARLLCNYLLFIFFSLKACTNAKWLRGDLPTRRVSRSAAEIQCRHRRLW